MRLCLQSNELKVIYKKVIAASEASSDDTIFVDSPDNQRSNWRKEPCRGRYCWKPNKNAVGCLVWRYIPAKIQGLLSIFKFII